MIIRYNIADSALQHNTGDYNTSLGKVGKYENQL